MGESGIITLLPQVILSQQSFIRHYQVLLTIGQPLKINSRFLQVKDGLPVIFLIYIRFYQLAIVKAAA